MSTNICKDASGCDEIIACCCPKPTLCRTDASHHPDCEFCCKNCKLQWIERKIPTPRTEENEYYFLRCDEQTRYNTPYYFKQRNVYNCCQGSFGWQTSSPYPNCPQPVFFTKNSRGGCLGDISYPRNQNGRWNQSTTNTKLFPVISKGRSARQFQRINCQDTPNTKCRLYTNNTQGDLKVAKQSGRLFNNTHPNMSKKQVFSYLSRNRAYLRR